MHFHAQDAHLLRTRATFHSAIERGHGRASIDSEERTRDRHDRCLGAYILCRGVLLYLRTSRWTRDDPSPLERQALEALNQTDTENSSPKRRALWLGNQGLDVASGLLAAIL